MLPPLFPQGPQHGRDTEAGALLGDRGLLMGKCGMALSESLVKLPLELPCTLKRLHHPLSFTQGQSASVRLSLSVAFCHHCLEYIFCTSYPVLPSTPNLHRSPKRRVSRVDLGPTHNFRNTSSHTLDQVQNPTSCISLLFQEKPPGSLEAERSP